MLAPVLEPKTFLSSNSFKKSQVSISITPQLREQYRFNGLSLSLSLSYRLSISLSIKKYFSNICCIFAAIKFFFTTRGRFHQRFYVQFLRAAFTCPGLNFINILRTAFKFVNPQSIKILLSHQYLFTLWGSASIKAVRRTLMILSPDVDSWKEKTWADLFLVRFDAID